MSVLSMTTGVRRLAGALTPIFFALLLSLPGMAQYRGSLQGTVTDTTGAVIPGAKVTLTSSETNITRETTTSDAGVYSFPALAPGRYNIHVEQTGFTPSTVEALLRSEQPQSQDVQLQVGKQTSQTVTVNASEGPALDTETATISGTFSHAAVQALPTFGRDTFQVATLAPGVFGDNSRGASGSGAQNLPGTAGPGGASGTSSIFATENQVQIAANGTRNSSNNIQVDGVSTNSLAWGGASIITPNKESVKEVTVQSNPYSAETGRNSGAQILVVSQNGTNEFHGSALMKFDRPGLNAYQRYNGPNNPVQKDTDRFNQWAGSLGGPIIKNHLFFFFSYETLRNSSTTTALGWYETPQFLKSATAPIASKLLSYPGEGVSFNAIVPKTCSDAGLTGAAQCQAIFSNGVYQGFDIGSPLRRVAPGTQDPSYVSSGTPGVGGGLDGIPDIMYVQSTTPMTRARTQYNGRADYQATQKDLIVFSTYYVPSNSSFYNGPARAANFWHSDRINYTGALLWNHTFSPLWLNEARANVTRWYFNEVTSNSQEPWGLPSDEHRQPGLLDLSAFRSAGTRHFLSDDLQLPRHGEHGARQSFFEGGR